MASGRASSSKDKYELDRLAEELETRQHSQGFGDIEIDSNTQLPVYVPLSHNNPDLNSDVFDIEKFLLSRSHTSLADLRAELRDYLGTLKEELVKLINDDYEAFISLSTDLKGEGFRLQQLKTPLSTIRSEILQSREELQAIQDAVQEKLSNRAALREEQSILHLLLKINDSMTRLETLLHITPQESSNSQEISEINMPTYLQLSPGDSIENKSQSGHAKHLGRVAAEYTQLSYHASKARANSCVYVDEVQWRIDRIHSTLSSDLDHLFSTTVKALVDGKIDGRNLSEMEKAKWTAELGECLRTYDTLGLWRDAEGVLRRDIVRGFVKKTIYHGTLTSPHSPILPHTPFELHVQPPRTPYTPFSAFASKKNPFETDYIQPFPRQVPLLEEDEDPLPQMYNQLLRFVERDLGKIMQLAEQVSHKSMAPSKSGHGLGLGLNSPTAASPVASAPLYDSSEDYKGFQIMSNVIWAEFGTAIMDELGTIVFAAGKPDEFRKNHETTVAFLRGLEFIAPSVQAIEAMRAHPVYIAFSKRWQLPVYFQLRWKDITSKLEPVLARYTLTSENKPDLKPFMTAAGDAVWKAVSTCWSAEVFIPDICHSLWKLTLQILTRYSVWLIRVLPEVDAEPSSAVSSKNTGPHIARPGTPSTPDTPSSSETHSVDEASLTQFSIAIHDIHALDRQVMKLWKEEISMMLPLDPEAVVTEEQQSTSEDILRHQLSRLSELVQPMTNQIISILTRRCNDSLLPMRSIPSQFRAMSNKRLPSEPSHFVPLVLRPLKAFFGIGGSDAPGSTLKERYLGPFSEEVFENVCQRYIYYLNNMKKTEESLRRLKKGKKATFSLFGSTSSKDDDNKDEERIRTQMIIDVNAFGKDAQSLGVQIDQSKSFEALRDLVHSSFAVEDEP